MTACPAPDDRSWAGRVYGLLLRAYPAAYRARFGSSMRDTFTRDHARIRTLGRAARLSFWIVTLAQALWFGAGERLRLRAGTGSLRTRAATGAASGALAHGPRRRIASTGPRWSPRADARHALRLLARSPLFTGTAIASLAIGIAASTTIFGLADALFVQPAPGVRDAARIVDIERTTNGRGFGTINYPVFQQLRDHARSFESMSATSRSPAPLSLRDGETSGRAYGLTVSSSYFDVLGARPALGRFFRAEEDSAPDAHPVVVLSHRFWRERFQSDPGVLDRPIRINNAEFDVIGVAERDFEGPTIIGTDLWLPMAMIGIIRGQPTADLLKGDSGDVWRRAIGRLKPGVTREAAQAELNTLLDTLKTGSRLVPASHAIILIPSGRLPGPTRVPFATFVALLAAITSGLLLIACSNVAGMLLARATTRQREMATRLAMGASRGRLVGQLLVETLVLFALAGVVALPLTIWLAKACQSLLPAMPLPLRAELPIGLRMVLLASAVSLATGLLFGLAPARHALRADIALMLQGGRAATDGRQRQRLRHGLVIAQVALALAMAITAGLFVRTLQAVSHMDAGFRTEHVEVVSLDTTVARAVGPAAAALARRVEDELRGVRGVEAVGYAAQIPLQGGSFDLGAIRVPGAGADAVTRLEDADWDVVSPDYFRAVGLPIRSGRAFTRADRAGGRLVAIVNETFARVAWPGQPAVGQLFWQMTGPTSTTPDGRPIEVIGVVKDAKYRSFDEPARPFIYVPFDQHPQTDVQWFLQHAPGAAIGPDVRAAIARAEPGLPVVLMQPFDDAVAFGLLPQRLAAWIAGAVGSIGLFLAALGLYGLAAFLVAQRRREIAIRMALGASPADVRSMVLRQAAWLGLAGGGAGLLLAAGLGRVIANLQLLVGVQSTDPLTFGGLALLLGLVLLAASYLPARSAAATDPAVALRAP